SAAGGEEEGSEAGGGGLQQRSMHGRYSWLGALVRDRAAWNPSMSKGRTSLPIAEMRRKPVRARGEAPRARGPTGGTGLARATSKRARRGRLGGSCGAVCDAVAGGTNET